MLNSNNMPVSGRHPEESRLSCKGHEDTLLGCPVTVSAMTAWPAQSGCAVYNILLMHT